MRVVVDRLAQRPGVSAAGLDPLVAARADLRRQIARLESRLAALGFELGASGRWLALPGVGPQLGPAPRTSAPGPRLLSLGELEAARDDLVEGIAAAQRVLGACLESEGNARVRLERMLADPPAHRFELVSCAELGGTACGAYAVRPRFGLLGMLFDWWCVKLSSGCP